MQKQTNNFLFFNKVRLIFRFSSHDTTTEAGRSNERYRRILLTGGSIAIVKVVSALVNFITVPLTVNYLGAERYGLWMTISSLLAFMSFADLGLGNGLLNAVSSANGQNKIKVAKIAISSTFFILLFISFVFLLVFLCIYPFIAWENVFNVKSILAIHESGPAILTLSIIFLVNLPLGIVQRIQDGYQEGYKFQIWLIFGSLLSLVGLILCIYFKAGLVWLVLAFSGGQLIVTFLNGVFLFKGKRKILTPNIKYFKLNEGVLLIKSGFLFLMLSVFTLLGYASDDIIISHTIAPSSIAGYEAVKKLFAFAMFTQFIIQPLWPAFAESIASGDLAWAKKTLKKGLLYSISAGAIFTFPLLLFGKQVICLWVGHAYVPTWSLLFGFYFFSIFSNYGGVMSTFLNSCHLLKGQLIIIGLTAASSVILKIYLSTKFDVSGIIWATLISHVVFYIIPTYKLGTNYLKSKETTI